MCNFRIEDDLGDITLAVVHNARQAGPLVPPVHAGILPRWYHDTMEGESAIMFVDWESLVCMLGRLRQMKDL